MKKIYILALLLMFGHASASQTPKTPSSLEEMIKGSDLILVGHLGKVISTQKFYGYQENAKYLAELDELSNIPIALIAVDYQIKIDSIIYDRNNTKDIKDDISYRIFQSPSVKDRQARNKEKAIFFLSKTPAKGNNYSIKSTFYRLQMNGVDPVSYSFKGKQIMVERADNKENLSSYDFLDKVVELSSIISEGLSN
jgi:hypothetical protein